MVGAAVPCRPPRQPTPPTNGRGGSPLPPAASPTNGRGGSPLPPAATPTNGRGGSPLPPAATTRSRSGLSKNLFACVRERNLRSPRRSVSVAFCRSSEFILHDLHGHSRAGGRGLPPLPLDDPRPNPCGRQGTAAPTVGRPRPSPCGRQGTAAPTVGRPTASTVRAAGDCRPYHWRVHGQPFYNFTRLNYPYRWVGGAAGEASGGTLVEPLSPLGVY